MARPTAGRILPSRISEDGAGAKAVLRRTASNCALMLMPNYRNYWTEAGYVEERTAIENALAEECEEDVRWLADITLFGPAAKGTDRNPAGVSGIRRLGYSPNWKMLAGSSP